jgi:hypothetical protein
VLCELPKLKGVVFEDIYKSQSSTHSPVKVHKLIELLNFYPNRDAALELSLGFLNGFRLQYTNSRTFLMTKNLRSVEQFRQDTLEKLQSEVSMIYS